MKKELVVARYQENIAWLSIVHPDFDIYLYEKNSIAEPVDVPIKKRELLPNIGNEAHTYLHHIVSQYSDPADLTFFVQGNPLDHSTYIFEYFVNQVEINQDYTTLCEKQCITNDVGQPWHFGLPVGKYYAEIFGKPMTQAFIFGAGAQFCVTKKAIQSKPLDFWIKLLELSKNTGEAPFVFERLWHKFFEC